MQNWGICYTASQLCTCWPRKMADALHASHACPFYSAFQLGQGSLVSIKSLLCSPGHPALTLESEKYSALAPVPLAKSTSKITEVNLQVSKVCFVWVSSPPFLLCKLSLVFIFHSFGKRFTVTAQALPSHWAAYRLCTAFDLHVKQELGNKRDIIRV